VWPPQKGLRVFFCKHWAHFVKKNNVGRHFCPDFQGFCPRVSGTLPGLSGILPRFLGILTGFSTYQNFSGWAWIPTSNVTGFNWCSPFNPFLAMYHYVQSNAWTLFTFPRRSPNGTALSAWLIAPRNFKANNNAVKLHKYLDLVFKLCTCLTFSPEKLHSDVNQQMNISNITKRIDHGQLQARNQLGTPVETKSFLRGAQIICRTHFFQGRKNFSLGTSPPPRHP